jgi:WD40 repeat protein
MGLAWSLDGSQIVISTTEGSRPLEMWNTADGTHQKLTVGGDAPRVDWLPDGTKLVVGNSHALSSLEIATGALQKYQVWVNDPLAWSADRRLLAYKGGDKKIAILNVEDGTLMQRLHKDTSGLTALCWAPDGRHLAAGFRDEKTVSIWSLDPEA